MLDAYTVRKAIPRILLAVIGINLSIYLCVAAVEITNVIGQGLGQLITDPFLKPDSFKDIGIEAGSITNNIAAGGLVIGAIVGGAALWSIGGLVVLATLIPFMITVGLICLAIIFTLIIRQGLLIFLTIISPVAIAFFVLPGTEKYFKQWWDLFLKTLLVYPIISAIFAISTAMGAILLGTAGDSAGPIGLAKIIATIVVVFAPLVLIPFAFKFAGGAIAAVMNAANGRASQTAGGMGKKMRENPDSLYSRAKDKSFERRSAKGLTGQAMLNRANPFLRGERRKGALAGVKQREDFMQAQKRMNQPAYQTNKEDDKFVYDLATYATGAESRAAIADGTHKQLRNTRADAEKMIRKRDGVAAGIALSAVQRAEVDQIYATTQEQLYAVSAAADRTGRGTAVRAEAASSQPYLAYGLDPGQAGWDEFKAAQDSIYGEGDSAEKRALTNKAQFIAKGSGRFDLSGATDYGEYDKDRGWNAASLYQLANAKPNDTKAHVERTIELLNSSNADERRQGAVRAKELKAMLPNATAGVQKVINDSMGTISSLEESFYRSLPSTPSTVDRVETYEETVSLPGGGSETVRRQRVVGKVSQAEVIRSEIEKRARTYERPDPNNL